MNIGKVFKKEREARGETQRAFAVKLGLTPAALWKIESGRNWPKQATVKRFVTETGIPVARLYIEALETEDYGRTS